MIEITKGDIFDNLGLSHSEAAELRMRAIVLESILSEIGRRNITQKQLCGLLDEYQPQISNLMHGKISKLSLDKLVRYADRLGIRFELHAHPPKRAKTRTETKHISKEELELATA